MRADIDRSGVLLADERVLRAMEADLAGKFIPVSLKRDTLSGKAAATEAEIASLEKTMRETIARIGTEMCAGGAQAQPRTLHGMDPCTYCAMKPLCRIRPADAAEADPETGKEES